MKKVLSILFLTFSVFSCSLFGPKQEEIDRMTTRVYSENIQTVRQGIINSLKEDYSIMKSEDENLIVASVEKKLTGNFMKVFLGKEDKLQTFIQVKLQELPNKNTKVVTTVSQIEKSLKTTGVLDVFAFEFYFPKETKNDSVIYKKEVYDSIYKDFDKSIEKLKK